MKCFKVDMFVLLIIGGVFFNERKVVVILGKELYVFIVVFLFFL